MIQLRKSSIRYNGASESKPVWGLFVTVGRAFVSNGANLVGRDIFYQHPNVGKPKVIL